MLGLLCAVLTVAVIVSADARVHTVRRGDTLWTIGRSYGVSSDAIARANGLKSTSILSLGRKLTIPGSSGRATSSSSASSSSKTKTAVVAKVAPLRAEPSSAARKIGSLPAGSTVKVLQYKWHWLQVKTASGAVGWAGDYLLRVKNPAPAPKPASVARSSSTKKTYAAKPTTSRSSSTRSKTVSKTASSHSKPAVASSSTSSKPASGSSTGVVRTAYAQQGARYRYGGTSRGGFDCSGFTRYVYSKHGVSLPHSSAAQAKKGAAVSKGELKPGDLVFFSTRGRKVGHVGVYSGNGKFIHASNPRGGVKVDSLNSGYYRNRFAGARRVK